MFLCSLIEELCTKEENDKTGCNFNFGHECILLNIKLAQGNDGKVKAIRELLAVSNVENCCDRNGEQKRSPIQIFEQQGYSYQKVCKQKL